MTRDSPPRKDFSRVLSGMIVCFALLPFCPDLFAHPGSGIVADRHGNIYFVDTGSGIWKIGTDNELTRVSGPAYHWMTVDPGGRLADVRLPSFSSGGATVTRAGADPTLILSSDFPLSVGPEGDLFYPWLSEDDELEILRLRPDGNSSIVLTLRSRVALRWLNGLAAGHDGSIYYTEDAAVRRITPQGKLLTVIEQRSFPGCEAVPGVEKNAGPYFRGLDVDVNGTVYVAAVGCGRVMRISTDGSATTLFQSATPWAPTGVAVSGDDLYILEYLHTEGDDRREWIPRVRKIDSDGKVITLATINR